MARMMRQRGRVAAAWGGIVSALVVLAIAEALALLVAREGSPLLAMGSFVIDVVPQPLKEFAISTFGENDKIVLLIGLGLAVAVAAALAGVLQLWRPPLGVVVIALAGAAATAATVTRAGATGWAWLPTVVGTLAGCAALMLFVGRIRRQNAATATSAAGSSAAGSSAAASSAAGSSTTPSDAASRATPSVVASGASTSPSASPVVPRETPTVHPKTKKVPASYDRRSFFLLTGMTALVAVAVGVGARTANLAATSVDAVRRMFRIPAPRSKVAIPDGAELDIADLSPLFTPNADFYRVDTALSVPSIDPSTWRLSISGMVDEPFELGYQDLLDMGLDEYVITLTCVSNEIGGGLVGNAKWLGVPLRDLIARAKPQAGADMVLSRSVDGFTASTPLASVTDPEIDAILAVAMNGEPLPLEHGYPVRMVVPGLYGYVSATKWLTEVSVTTFEQDEAYWTPRGYSAKAPIKFSSRVDTPRAGKRVPAGTVPIAGVAWAQTVGIERVEISIDDGDWQQATLSTAVNDDSWVQWFYEWDATPGNHYVTVRATNRAGEVQIEEKAPIAPDGSSGWQRTLILVD